MLAIKRLYRRLLSVGSGQRTKMQGTSVARNFIRSSANKGLITLIMPIPTCTTSSSKSTLISGQWHSTDRMRNCVTPCKTRVKSLAASIWFNTSLSFDSLSKCPFFKIRQLYIFFVLLSTYFPVKSNLSFTHSFCKSFCKTT